MVNGSKRKETQSEGWKDQDPLAVEVEMMVMKIEEKKTYKPQQKTFTP